MYDTTALYTVNKPEGRAVQRFMELWHQSQSSKDKEHDDTESSGGHVTDREQAPASGSYPSSQSSPTTLTTLTSSQSSPTTLTTQDHGEDGEVYKDTRYSR